MSRIESNSQALAKEQAEAAGRLRQASGGFLSVSPSRSGQPTAKIGERWIHSAYDPIQEARRWADAQRAELKDGDVAVILGVGLLYHVEALCAILPQDQRIAVVVPDLREWRDAGEARDWGAWATRVRWCLGSALEMAQSVMALGSRLRILRYTPAADLHETAIGAFEAALREGAAAKAGGRLHVALVGPIYGGSLPIARYVRSALEQLGHRVSWYDHSSHHVSYEAFGGLQSSRNRQVLQGHFGELLGQFTLARVAEDPPDLVFAMAQAPLSLGILQQLRKRNFLTTMWFVENYRHLTYWQQVASGYDYWFVIQRGACIDALRAAGASSVHYLPMAADPTVHRALSLSPVEQTEFGADLSFVGAGYANRRELLPTLLSRDWSFKLWGNEWDGADGVRSVLQRNGARIDTDTCMKIFNATTVNLNLHSHTGRGFDPQADFVNPRTFELAACGAFQLTDRRSLLPELFTAQEVATVSDPASLSSEIGRWLHEPAARDAMRAAAQRRVLVEHTYRHRAAALLTQVGMSQPDRIGALLQGARAPEALVSRAADCPELIPLIRASGARPRVELKDVADAIRRKGPTAKLDREELLLLMLDEYRNETRDAA
ncbi:MAG: glycosyltransferase [Nitrospiraceae bacterium]